MQHQTSRPWHLLEIPVCAIDGDVLGDVYEAFASRWTRVRLFFRLDDEVSLYILDCVNRRSDTTMCHRPFLSQKVFLSFPGPRSHVFSLEMHAFIVLRLLVCALTMLLRAVQALGLVSLSPC